MSQYFYTWSPSATGKNQLKRIDLSTMKMDTDSSNWGMTYPNVPADGADIATALTAAANTVQTASGGPIQSTTQSSVPAWVGNWTSKVQVVTTNQTANPNPGGAISRLSKKPPAYYGTATDGFTGERELMLGAIYGARRWAVDSLGRLTGVTYGEVHKPGVNTAVCGKGFALSDHDMTQCSHGYHAYFDGERLAFGGEVTGVIEGTGETLIGDKGFRTMKQKIVALAVPGSEKSFNLPVEDAAPEPEAEVEDAEKGPSLVKRALTLLGKTMPRRRMFHFSRRVAPVALLSLWIVSAINIGLPIFTKVSPVIGGLILLSAAYPALVLLTDSASWRRPLMVGVTTITDDAITGVTTSDTATRIATKLAELYPDVPIYTTEAELFAKHPVSKAEDFKPAAPSPENDPDFWNRP